MFVKLRKTKNCWSGIFNPGLKKKTDSSTLTSETSEKIISLHLSLVFFLGVCIYVGYFFDVVRNQTSNKKYPLELMKSRLKVYEKFMSRKRALNFDQW